MTDQPNDKPRGEAGTGTAGRKSIELSKSQVEELHRSTNEARSRFGTANREEAEPDPDGSPSCASRMKQVFQSGLTKAHLESSRRDE